MGTHTPKYQALFKEQIGSHQQDGVIIIFIVQSSETTHPSSYHHLSMIACKV